MVKNSRKSPGVGHNSGNLPDQATYRMGLALVVLMEEEKAKMNERHKALRKRMIEGKGMAQDDVKLMYKMRDDALSDITNYLKRKAHALGAMFFKSFQLDMFTPDPEAFEAIRFKGMLAGVAGEPCVPPTTLSDEERNVYIEGHKNGFDAREATIKEMSAEFVDGKDGDFSDPALKTRAKNKATAKNVGLKAAADFKADNPEVKPAGEEQPFEAPADELAAQKPRAQSAKADEALAEAGID